MYSLMAHGSCCYHQPNVPHQQDCLKGLMGLFYDLSVDFGNEKFYHIYLYVWCIFNTLSRHFSSKSHKSTTEETVMPSPSYT